MQSRRQGACFDEDAEFDVVVDAGAGEVGAGDQGRGPVGDHGLGVEAGRLGEERLAGFEGPSVEVRGVLDRRERVRGANNQLAAGIVGGLEDERHVHSPVDGLREICRELGDVVAHERDEHEALGCVGDQCVEHRPCRPQTDGLRRWACPHKADLVLGSHGPGSGSCRPDRRGHDGSGNVGGARPSPCDRRGVFAVMSRGAGTDQCGLRLRRPTGSVLDCRGTRCQKVARHLHGCVDDRAGHHIRGPADGRVDDRAGHHIRRVDDRAGHHIRSVDDRAGHHIRRPTDGRVDGRAAHRVRGCVGRRVGHVK